MPNGHRLRRAVRVVRVIAANRGDRLERFMPSADRARRRVFVTRYMRSGHGDEFSARDAMSAARAAMTSVKDMHRATTFEAGNPHSIARKEFATMAQAADECITKVAGIDKGRPAGGPAGEHQPAEPDDRRSGGPARRACSGLTRAAFVSWQR
ncbi:hypothetical protein [Nonomuraea sp. 10N515B]|uniref:hypothetical protein n=1 Tax=Nonomuraea sp. 10N515B TaxID=3457422 RepID=UPI003FCEA0FF